MIWIVGGTTEAILLGKHLSDVEHIITYGTEEGVERGVGNSVYRRMDEIEMEQFIDDYSIKLILDVTHPFAKNVTENVKNAAKNKNVKYLRYERKTTHMPDNSIVVASFDECYEVLKGLHGTVLVTTGSNNVKDFEVVKGENRYVYRILPTTESVKKVRDLGVGMDDIIAMMGPFTKELNIAFLKFYNCKYMVLKNSGDVGGTEEKMKACKEIGVVPIVIGRNTEGYLTDWNEFIAEINLHENNVLRRIYEKDK